MKNLKNFIKENKNINLPSTREIKAAVLTNLADSSIAPSFQKITTSEKEKFSTEVAQLANSDEILTKLIEELGEPKDSESEDEFVKRGKSILSKILKNKLMK